MSESPCLNLEGRRAISCPTHAVTELISPRANPKVSATAPRIVLSIVLAAHPSSYLLKIEDHPFYDPLIRFRQPTGGISCQEIPPDSFNEMCPP
eukprot:391237-Prymnesium_polylepis.1